MLQGVLKSITNLKKIISKTFLIKRSRPMTNISYILIMCLEKIINFYRNKNAICTTKPFSITPDCFNDYFSTVAGKVIISIIKSDVDPRSFMKETTVSRSSIFLCPMTEIELKNSNCTDFFFA